LVENFRVSDDKMEEDGTYLIGKSNTWFGRNRLASRLVELGL
jgi:hypothetical protein